MNKRNEFKVNKRMRAREFVINVPINIKINGDGDPEISASDEPQTPSTDTLLAPAEPTGPRKTEKDTGVMVPPLQQKLELMKKAAGKQGPVVDQITADDDNEAS